MNIETITRDATLDDLSVSDYHDLLHEVRYDSVTDKLMSLDKLRDHVHSFYSKALWGQFANREIVPNRGMRNELRLARGLPLLPPTVAEATSQVSPDAHVVRVGEGVPDVVVMMASGEPVSLQIDDAGNIELIKRNLVTSVTTKRKPVVRPVVSLEQDSRRSSMRVTWTDVIEAGLQYLEKRL